MAEKKTVVLIRSEVPTMWRDGYVPNNILYLAEALLKNGYSPFLIDMRVENYKERMALLDFDDVLFVGISTLTGPQIKYGLECAQYIHKKNPSIPIVWGGPHPSLRPEETARHPLCHVVVRGEGDETVVELANAFSTQTPLKDIQGITFRNGDTIESTPDRDHWLDLDTVDLLPYHLLRMNRYGRENFSYNTSRGCPHRCTFCINHAYNKSSYRVQSPAKVIENVEHIIHTAGTRHLIFNDDNFFVNRKRVEELCNLFLEKNLNISWMTSCRFDYFSKFSDDFLKLLQDSGCRQLGYGIESGSPRILSYIEKGITPEQVKISVIKAKKIGVLLSPVSFMYGFPTETIKDLHKSIDLIDKIRRFGEDNTIVNGMFQLTPYPGTPIEQQLLKQGYRFPERLEDWSGYIMSAAMKKVTWLDKEYLDQAAAVSHMIRFRYFLSIKAHRKLKSKFLRALYWGFTAPFLVSEQIRWRLRFFKFAYEWRFWAFVRTSVLKIT